MTTTVYQTDAAGVYLGPVTADESPLEPGVLLLPRGCVETAPPAIPAGQRARWTGLAWVLEDVPVPPVPPVPTPEEVLAARRASLSLTFAQMLIGLVAEGWISEVEGEAWLGGALPAPVIGLIATLPAGQRFAARARAARPSIVLRSDPLVAALAAAQGRSADELDAFFEAYALV